VDEEIADVKRIRNWWLFTRRERIVQREGEADCRTAGDRGLRRRIERLGEGAERPDVRVLDDGRDVVEDERAIEAVRERGDGREREDGGDDEAQAERSPERRTAADGRRSSRMLGGAPAQD
jgi:hypothetical protein